MNTPKNTDEIIKMLRETPWFSICAGCVHSDVCKHTEEVKKKNAKDGCEHFKQRLDPERYWTINEMFEPIFQWMQHHYPAGGVSFHVDHNSAKMMQEHGVSVYSKDIQECCCCFQTDENGG